MSQGFQMLFENEVFHEKDFACLDIIKGFGFDVVTVNHFGEYAKLKRLDPDNNHILTRGSFMLLREVEHTDWMPNHWVKNEQVRNLYYSNYVEKVGIGKSWFVNGDFTVKSFENAIKDIEGNQLALPFEYFIRPDSPIKLFSGQLMKPDKMRKEFDFYTIQKNGDPKTKVIVANPVKIFREYRFVVIDGEVVDGTRYLEQGELSVDKNDSDVIRAAAFADIVVKKFEWHPAPIYIIDIAEIESNTITVRTKAFKILELNPFNSASLYHPDIYKSVLPILMQKCRDLE